MSKESQGMLKILIIDDEKSILNVLSILLKSEGYDIITANSGEGGLELFQQELPDIVITDIKMPGMSGLEVLRKIKEQNPDDEVIIMTGHGDMDSAIESLQYGASDFINKPVGDTALLIAIKRAEEKINIRQKLREYTSDLEDMIDIATTEIRRKSEFQANLISSSNDGIIATDHEGKIIIFNPGAERIFGYSQSEVVRSMHAYSILPAEIANKLREGLGNKGLVNVLNFKELRILSKGGEEVPVRFSSTILYENGSVMGSVVFLQDLREIKHLERELVRSERLAAIGQTVAGLAHYIKNILTGLKGGAYIVDTGLNKNDTDKLRKGWKMIKKNISQISELVLNLLSYSKERSPEYSNCNPNEIVSEVCQLMEEKARENDIEIMKYLDASISEVFIDPQTIHRCLLNIISNAIDACIFDNETSKSYHVYVKTLLEEDNMIRFEVCDNGSGINEDVKAKLFSSFYSTKMGKGTGLGLLVTKKLVEEHGGEIDVISQLGEGSSFAIKLPCRVIKEESKIVVNR